MQDFSQLSSKMVTEVLMLEIKMAPAAKAYIISGFPRSMRDVVEYSDKVGPWTAFLRQSSQNKIHSAFSYAHKQKLPNNRPQIQVVSGVVLISWRQTVLQKQIDYGVKLGQVVLSLAKMELTNFYKNVIPVSEYFDQSGLLSVVNGERNPNDVYKDFRSAVLEILGSQDDQSRMIPNGGPPRAHTTIDIPGVIVETEAEARKWPEIGDSGDSVGADDTGDDDVDEMVAATSDDLQKAKNTRAQITVPVVVEPNVDLLQTPRPANNNADPSELPPIIWVVGGPGSNKSTLCLKAVALNPGWGHFR